MAKNPTAALVDSAQRRGYVGIGVYDSKYETNLGTLIRSAHAMGGTFVFTIGRRYESQPSAVGQDRHIPVFNFDSIESLSTAMPAEADLVCVEIGHGSHVLPRFPHPERAVYLLGAEDYGLPESILSDHTVVEVPSEWPLNVATVGSIVLYDRLAKRIEAACDGLEINSN